MRTILLVLSLVLLALSPAAQTFPVVPITCGGIQHNQTLASNSCRSGTGAPLPGGISSVKAFCDILDYNPAPVGGAVFPGGDLWIAQYGVSSSAPWTHTAPNTWVGVLLVSAAVSSSTVFPLAVPGLNLLWTDPLATVVVSPTIVVPFSSDLAYNHCTPSYPMALPPGGQTSIHFYAWTLPLTIPPGFDLTLQTARIDVPTNTTTLSIGWRVNF